MGFRLILPNIAFEGLDHDDACVKDDNFFKIDVTKIGFGKDEDKKQSAIIAALRKPLIDMEDVATLMSGTTADLGTTAAATAGLDPDTVAFFEAFTKDGTGKVEFNPGQDNFMRRIYRGFSAADAAGSKILTSNAGHLGEVDSLEHCNRVWGTAGGQIYKQRTYVTK